MPRARTKRQQGTGRTSSGARPRATAIAKKAPQKARYTCPDCGATFDRPQSLGAHRRQAHGIAGTSKRTLSRQAGAASAANGRSPQRRARTATGPTGAAARPAAPGADGVDRDRLLQSLFPNGIPARESVIREVNAWLDQAERLARLR